MLGEVTPLALPADQMFSSLMNLVGEVAFSGVGHGGVERVSLLLWKTEETDTSLIGIPSFSLAFAKHSVWKC